MVKDYWSGEVTSLSRPQTFGEQLASSIRRDIVSGLLPSGTVLPQEKLCEMYGVSRVPVRDALLALSNEGFVTPNRRHQMVVVEFTDQDLMDTFRINAFLSGLSARRAAMAATEEDLDHIDGIVQNATRMDPERDRTELAALQWNFHRAVNFAARSNRLLATLRATSTPLIQDFMREIGAWWEVSQHEHAEIVQALRDRDPDRAEQLMTRHFDHAGKALAAYLGERTAKAASSS